MRRSRTENSAIYGYQNKPDDNDGVYQTNNEPEGIYHIPFIDSNNYMKTNIMHTQLYGDKGKPHSVLLLIYSSCNSDVNKVLFL